MPARAYPLPATLILALLPLAGCSQVQSTIAPGGPHAGEIATLFWIFVAVCTLVWLFVVAALGFALLRRRPVCSDPLALDLARERGGGRIVLACTAATAAVIFGLTLASFFAQRTLWADHKTALTLQVTGHQWWWDVEYQDSDPSRVFTSANEIHIPVGEPVIVELRTSDVIHSFWVPSLAGKMDQISGHTNEMRLVASRPGVYRGQCAEFCGLEHALMAFLIVASPRDEFDLWYAGQLEPAATPAGADAERGRHIFLTRSCALCHALRGTPAGGKVGPDLTHLAGRRTLAAGTAPLTSGHLAAWLADPQHLKPGNQMPWPELSGPEIGLLVTYLMSLR